MSEANPELDKSKMTPEQLEGYNRAMHNLAYFFLGAGYHADPKKIKVVEDAPFPYSKDSTKAQSVNELVGG